MNRKLRGALRSRTMRIALVVELLAVVQMHSEALSAYLTPPQLGLVLLLIGLAIRWGRWMTDRPLDER